MTAQHPKGIMAAIGVDEHMRDVVRAKGRFNPATRMGREESGPANNPGAARVVVQDGDRHVLPPFQCASSLWV